jgi:energy-converting hydrogenase A subunit R
VNKKIFASDCEGPISVNDNAFELSSHFIEDGAKFFAIISKYDDILADEIKRPGYNAGDTLKLIVPFLKAYGATNNNIIKFSAEHVLLIPNAKESLAFVNNNMPSFLISTSYEQYIRALCELVDFPFEHTYSTKLDIDSPTLDLDEQKRLKELRKIIVEDPDFEKLEQIFWDEIPSMKIGRIIETVKTVGGDGKKDAIKDILNRFNFKASDLMYVGDSITDVESFRFTKDHRGLTLSFNGNEYAIREAEIAVLSENATITSLIADLFNRFGRKYVLEFVESYSIDPEKSFEEFSLNFKLREVIKSSRFPQMEIINRKNRDRLSSESCEFRKMVRGESIGGLG